MKIAVLLNEFPTVSETFILDQLVALCEAGHELTIVADPAPAGMPVHTDVIAHRLIERTRYSAPLPADKWARLFDAAGRLARHLPFEPRLLRALDPRRGRWALSLRLLYAALPFVGAPAFDVVHAHYGPNGRLAAALREMGLLRGPLLTSFHGYDLRQLPQREGPGYYADLFRRGDAFTVGSEFARRSLVSLGCERERITIQRVGVPLERFAFSARRMPADGVITLLSVARLTDVKGLRYGIAAVAALAPRYPALRYRIVGDGPLRDDLAAEIRRHGVSERVELLGWRTREELLELYRDAQLFVHPCVKTASGEEEGQGLALQEAQALGLPVIASDHGALPEGMLPDESGYLVPEGDVNALAARIAELLDNPGRWAAMGRAGRRFVEERFDLRRQNDALLSLYQRIAAFDPELAAAERR
ncbi:MAG: glycosyltransferase [Myxococcales bacterium]|nr:glycosyltransferase [Myxococcales bacterium]